MLAADSFGMVVGSFDRICLADHSLDYVVVVVVHHSSADHIVSNFHHIAADLRIVVDGVVAAAAVVPDTADLHIDCIRLPDMIVRAGMIERLV